MSGTSVRTKRIARACAPRWRKIFVRKRPPARERCEKSTSPLPSRRTRRSAGTIPSTMALIESTLAGLPGQLHQRPWRNFAHNRNEALDYGRAFLRTLPASPTGAPDWLMVIDADEALAAKHEALSIAEELGKMHLTRRSSRARRRGS